MASGYLEVQGLSVAMAAMDMMCKSAHVQVTALDANNTTDDKHAIVPVVIQVKLTGGISDVSHALSIGEQTARRYLPEQFILTHTITSNQQELMPFLSSGKLRQHLTPRSKKNPGAIGAVDVHCFANAIKLLDDMLKSTNVSLLDMKKYMGGQTVTLLLGGAVSNVQAALDCAAYNNGASSGLKNASLITNPHPDLFRFIG